MVVGVFEECQRRQVDESVLKGEAHQRPSVLREVRAFIFP